MRWSPTERSWMSTEPILLVLCSLWIRREVSVNAIAVLSSVCCNNHLSPAIHSSPLRVSAPPFSESCRLLSSRRTRPMSLSTDPTSLLTVSAVLIPLVPVLMAPLVPLSHGADGSHRVHGLGQLGESVRRGGGERGGRCRGGEGAQRRGGLAGVLEGVPRRQRVAVPALLRLTVSHHHNHRLRGCTRCTRHTTHHTIRHTIRHTTHRTSYTTHHITH